MYKVTIGMNYKTLQLLGDNLIGVLTVEQTAHCFDIGSVVLVGSLFCFPSLCSFPLFLKSRETTS